MLIKYRHPILFCTQEISTPGDPSVLHWTKQWCLVTSSWPKTDGWLLSVVATMAKVTSPVHGAAAPQHSHYHHLYSCYSSHTARWRHPHVNRGGEKKPFRFCRRVSHPHKIHKKQQCKNKTALGEQNITRWFSCCCLWKHIEAFLQSLLKSFSIFSNEGVMQAKQKTKEWKWNE